jgi:membrane fusion protein, multidrug efflux system
MAPAGAMSRRRALALSLLGVLVLLAGVWGVQAWRHWNRHVSTDDAFVEAHVSPVSARVRGTVAEVLVRDNQEVAAGAPLVRLDPRDLEVKVLQARAALATAESRLRMAAAGLPMTDASTRSQVALAEATAARAALGIDSARRVLDERRPGSGLDARAWPRLRALQFHPDDRRERRHRADGHPAAARRPDPPGAAGDPRQPL